MNWDQIEGKWKQAKGSVRQQWGKLTDDDLEYIAGKRDHFVGRLQERYGMAKEEAQKRADEWAKQQNLETKKMKDDMGQTTPEYEHHSSSKR
jgi:uncharacterized protein YjbJ (UPF0337 family)